MRRLLALLLFAVVALVPAGCRPQAEGAIDVVVIGGTPRVRDPTTDPLSASDEVLLQNVAQGLVAFDPNGNIVGGLAERWTVSDDGLSYIFRIQSADWPDGGRINAQQVARILKRQLAARSRNPIKDTLGAVQEVVAMTDRVIEIRLGAPRPNLLPLLAEPQFAILRRGYGTGPFRFARAGQNGGELRLVRDVLSGDDEVTRRDELLLSGAPAAQAIERFASGKADLVLGGTFADLPLTRRVKLPRNSLRFDPASGLFGLVPLRERGGLDDANLRRLLSQAIDRDAFVAAGGVPGLAARATLLEPGLDGLPPPVAPAFLATPLAQRLPGLQTAVAREFGDQPRPAIRIALPQGPGADLLFQLLSNNWGALGFTVERARNAAMADFALVDEVAPSSSPAWFARRFRCAATPICDKQVDELLEAARTTLVPAQRYALLAQAAARVDDQQLFIPIAAPVRWSLVSRRIQSFAGNRYARHTLVDLEEKDNGD